VAIPANHVQENAEMRAPEMRTFEARLLGLLCRGECGAGLRDELLAGLAGYVFQGADHQAVFDCLRSLGREKPARIRELLPARLVQAGFPDVDLAPFFLHEEIGDAEAATLLRKLVASR
jgi:hypothetical protein